MAADVSVLRTERLVLRAIEPGDAAAFLSIYSDPETMRYWSDAPISKLEEAADMVNADVALAEAGEAMFWAITPGPGRGAIGKCTLIGFDRRNRRAEVGFILNRAHWGLGLMREALTAVIDFAFDELGLHRIEADTDVGNEASLGLLERLGFRREGLARERWCVYGEWQDSVLLGLLEGDWRALRKELAATR